MEDSEGLDSKTHLPTVDAKRSYTLEAVLGLYLLSTDPIEKFSERYKLNPALVLKFAQLGRWDELRAAHTERAAEVLRLAATAQVEDSIDLEIKKQAFRNIQDETFVARLAAHYERYGHLNVVDLKTGQELMDPAGFPIPLKIPHSLKSPHDLIQSLRKNLAESLAQGKAREEARKGNGSKAIEITDYEHIFNSSDGSPVKPNE